MVHFPYTCQLFPSLTLNNKNCIEGAIGHFTWKDCVREYILNIQYSGAPMKEFENERYLPKNTLYMEKE